jgi:deoxyxylulose-5-phosphate synthase
MATARDLRGSHEHVVAVCGDAAFTCGITLEALNNVVSSTKRLIVILNDNEWSIAKNVGAISALPQPHQHQPHLQQAAPRRGGVLQELPRPAWR